MIVLDASALVELLLNTTAGRVIANRIDDPALGIHVPHLVDVEVAQALRKFTLQKGDLTPDEASQALADLRALDLQRHAHEPLLDRVWELRQNVTAYDATYIALAEVLDTILLMTCDGPLARAPVWPPASSSSPLNPLPLRNDGEVDSPETMALENRRQDSYEASSARRRDPHWIRGASATMPTGCGIAGHTRASTRNAIDPMPRLNDPRDTTILPVSDSGTEEKNAINRPSIIIDPPARNAQSFQA